MDYKNFQKNDNITEPEIVSYINTKCEIPNIKITNNIWLNEIIKPELLKYGKPTAEILKNLFFTANKIQVFRNIYYPNSKIQINSGWRPREYNNFLIKQGYKADMNSEHIYGNAIDFKIIGCSTEETSQKLKNYWKGRWYYEQGFIHVDSTIKRGIRADW